jgi:polyisoprenoid-binding protein YceI
MRLWVCLLVLALAAPALAAPQRYTLERDKSQVRFETDFGTQQITGRFPVAEAEMTLDFDRAANSDVRVVLDATGAEASFPFAASAMKGPTVLDTARFATITFTSRRLRASGATATVEGDLTLRGVTRPMTMQADIYLQAGQAPGDLGHLTVRLRGTISRAAFGASGWPEFVGDEVRLDVLARIARVD